MVAESIEYQLRVAGAAQAQAEMDKLVRSLEQSAASERKVSLSADQMSQSLRAAARMSEVMERQQQRTAVSLDAATSSSTNLAGAGARVGSVLNMVGSSAAQLDGPLGGMIGSVGKATLAWNSMAAILGTGGPWAVAIGGAVLAISAYDDVQKLLAFDVDATTAAIDKQVAALHESEKAMAAQAKARNDSGFATAKAGVDARAAVERNNRGLTPEQQRQLEEVNRAEAVAGDAGQIGAGVESAGKAKPGPDTEFKTLQRQDANDARIRELRKKEDESQQRLSGYTGDTDPTLKQKLTAIDEQSKAEKDAFSQRVRDAKAADKEMAKLDANTEKRYADLRGVGQETFNTIGSAALAAAAQAAISGDDFLKTLSAALGGVLVADGIKNEMAGLGRALFSYGLDPTSEALIALGAVEIATGIGFGAAGKSSGGGGGGGAGGRATPQQDYASHRDDKGGQGPDTRLSAEQWDQYDRNSGSQRPTVVNNFNSPSIVSPTSKDSANVGKANRITRLKGYKVPS